MALVEREELLAGVTSLLDDCRAGTGQVALIEGPPGTGRTQLLLALGDRARQAGFHVLSAICSREERNLPLGTLTQLVRGTALPEGLAGQIDRLLAAGAAIAAAQPGDAVPTERLVRVFHGLSTALVDLSVERPILIAVDDVRHADAPSLQYLLHLARRLGPARIVLALTDTVERRAPHLPFRAELLRQPRSRRMQLGPLRPDGVRKVLAQRLGAACAARLTPSFTAASGGNPLLLHALIEDHLQGGEPSPHGYGLAVLACLHRGDPAVLRVAHGLAVLGQDATPEQVAWLVDVDAETVAQTVAAMDDAGLLDAGRFRHPAARLAVLDDLSPQCRADLHLRAAQLSYERGAPAIEAARHLIRADRPGQSWTVTVLQEAAEQALLDRDVELAARCLRHALAATTDERRRAAVRLRLAQSEWEANPATAAQHLTALAEAARSGLLDRRDQPWLVKALLWHARGGDAVQILDRLRGPDPERGPTEGPERPQDDLRDLELWLAGSYPALARRSSGRRVQQHDISTALTVDPWLRSAGTLADLLVRDRGDEASALAEQTLRNLRLRGGTPWAEESAALALSVLIYTDRCDSALDWCEWLTEKSSVGGTPTARAHAAAARAEIAVRQGNLRAAVSHAESALTLLLAKSWGVGIGAPLGSAILATTRMGDYEAAARYLSQEVPDALFQSRYGLPYLHARGHYHLATNQHHAALADFLACGELMRAWGLDIAGIVPWRANAADAWLRLGNPDQARLLVFDQLARAGSDGTRARAVALRVLAAANPPSKQLQLLGEALDIFESRGDRFEQAQVLSELSRAYNALDQKRRARVLLRQALHVADVCDAKPLRHELLPLAGDAADLAPAHPEPSGIESLTESERRVASLAVMGYTNREIAIKLYITASTVEQHLTRVYRKLSVKHRKELPAGLWAGSARPRQRAGKGGRF